MNEKLQVFRSQYEAARAAQIAFDHAQHLAAKHNVTDPPLIHNFKVNIALLHGSDLRQS